MSLRLLIIGAHPDDADYHAGGLAALYRTAGHTVKMVSLTNGRSGHHLQPGTELSRRRKAEAAAAGAIIGATYDVFDIPDGELLPTLENRARVIRLIREFRPDLVLTHRPNDYHPDHRYTSQLVQDTAYLLTVPAIVPEVPHLAHDPVIMYLPDHFQKPTPFDAAVAVGVDGVLDKIVAMLDCHESQFYEWLPYNQGCADQVPTDSGARRAWLAKPLKQRLRNQADRFREPLINAYGRERGEQFQFAEGFETCEYGAPLDAAAREKLFGWLGSGAP
jgi:LmbE family N-acetylglucosaminyl deacetylase